MSLLLDDATSQYARNISGGLVLPVNGWTIGVIALCDNVNFGTDQNVFEVSSNTANYVRIAVGTAFAGDPIRVYTRGAPTSTVYAAITTGGVTQDQWFSAIAVYHSSTNLRAYRDGGNMGQSTNESIVTPTNIYAGGTVLGTGFFSGNVALAWISPTPWSPSMVARQTIVAGSLYLHPKKIDALAHFYEFWPESVIDRRGGLHLTLVNGPTFSTDMPAIAGLGDEMLMGA